MKLPCELVVWYILPNIRRELARSLVKDLKLTQREAAKKLGLTESAVSQYLKSKRGREMKFDENINAEIETSIRDICKAGDDSLVVEKICSICKLIRNNGALCELHKTHGDLPDSCRVCMEVSK